MSGGISKFEAAKALFRIASAVELIVEADVCEDGAGQLLSEHAKQLQVIASVLNEHPMDDEAIAGARKILMIDTHSASTGDPHRLGQDNDGIACEGLP